MEGGALSTRISKRKDKTMSNKAMTRLHAEVGNKLVDIENIFKRSGVPMPNITLFARNPTNDKMTIIFSTEKSNDDIRRSFEIAMASIETKVTVTESEALSALISGG